MHISSKGNRWISQNLLNQLPTSHVCGGQTVWKEWGGSNNCDDLFVQIIKLNKLEWCKNSLKLMQGETSIHSCISNKGKKLTLATVL